MADNLQTLGQALVDVMQEMDATGLNHGTAGNASLRWGDKYLITPSGIPARDLTADLMVLVDDDGAYEGDTRPSSEWQMHVGLLAGRPDINALVHCHSQYATTLACANKSIPPLHYMTAISGGPEILVAPYAVFGSAALAEKVIATLDGRRACLMANHGQIALGRTAAEALMIASEVEVQASFYHGTLAIGGPTLLTDDQMGEVFGAFMTYGQQKKK